MFARTIKYTEKSFIAAFVVLGLFWVGYLSIKKMEKQTTFEIMQERVSEFIEHQESRTPLTTLGAEKK